MPYRCIHCSKFYEDGSKEVLEGCSNCKKRFFFYIKKEKFKEILEREVIDLKKNEKEKMEFDVREITGITDEESPVFLDFESVRLLRQGKYLIDLSKLFSEKPKIYQLEDGKYIVDLSILQSKNSKSKDI